MRAFSAFIGSITVVLWATSAPATLVPRPDTVADTSTGLIWQWAAPASQMSWSAASVYCASLELDGHGGFRLPTRLELASLVDYGRSQPAIDPDLFPGTAPIWFWTSTPYAGSSLFVWLVSFYDGGSLFGHVREDGAVRCVTGVSALEPDLVVGADTVQDRATGLTWQRVGAQFPVSHASTAEASCNKLKLGGYSAGWRLPTVRELLTLVDTRTSVPAIDRSAFPDTRSAPYWTRSIDAEDRRPWLVNFRYGYVETDDEEYMPYARCVH